MSDVMVKMINRKRRYSDGSQDVICTPSLIKSQIYLSPNVSLSNESTSRYKRQQVCDIQRQEKDTTLVDVLQQLDVSSMDVLQHWDVTSVDVLQEMNDKILEAVQDRAQQEKDMTQMSAEQNNHEKPVNMRQQTATRSDIRTRSIQADDKTNLLTAIESGDVCLASKLLKTYLPKDVLNQALISACLHGLKYVVQTLVGLGANIEFKDTQGNTPLMISAANGFIDIVRFLLMNNADVNVFNSAGDTALILSIRPSGSSEMVKVLLAQEEIDITHQNRYGCTALMKAIEVMDIGTIKILMDVSNYLKFDSPDYSQSVSDIERLDKQYTGLKEPTNFKGETSLQLAEKCGLGGIFQIFSKYRKAGVNPLIIATEIRNTDVFNILLNCQFLENREGAAIEALRHIFEHFEINKVKTINDNEREMIKRLLECGADTIWDNEPLSIAVNMGDYGLVKLLCKYLFRAKSQGFIDVEVLETAVKSGRCDIVELLLKYKTDINQANYLGSLLDWSLCYDQINCAKLLIQHGAEMNIMGCLESAVDHQAVKSMNFLVDNYKQNIRRFADIPRLSKLLIQAVQGGSLKIIGHLIDAGADVNLETSSRQTALSESKNGEVVKYLFRRGADVNHVTPGGISPLLNVLVFKYRCSDGYDSSTLTVVKALLDSGACVNGSSKDGRTALMEARSVDMLQLVLDKGADINQQDARGKTALILAVRRDGFELVETLINSGADVNIKDENGNTALLHSLIQPFTSSEDIIVTLIRFGSNVNCQNNDGFSPLMIAAKNCMNDIITVLIDAGADVNAVSRKDNTKTALTFLTDIVGYSEDGILCMDTLLERGANTTYVKPDVVHKIIFTCASDLIPKLIRGGLGAADVDVDLRFDADLSKVLRGYGITTLSPLCVALLTEDLEAALYFVETLFLTNSDVTSLTRNMNLRRALEKSTNLQCREFFVEMSSQPLSLFKLAFVTVSSAIGTSPGREIRVDNLLLPQVIKDRLLFKSEDVPFKHTAEYMNNSRVLSVSWFQGFLADIYKDQIG